MAERWTHILHIPKTGGTAIVEALAPVASAFRIKCRRHDVRLSDIPEDEDIVVFVREPVRRFVSAFNTRLRRGRPRYSFGWSSGEAVAFARFSTPNQLAEALTSPDPSTVAQAREAMESIRFVNATNKEWLGTLDDVRARRQHVVLLGVQCFLQSDFEFLKRKLGLPDEVALPLDPILSHRTPPGHETQLSALGHANISKWYAEDIKFYNEYQHLRSEWHGLEPDAQSVLATEGGASFREA
jgi:hypothetical protein